MSKLVRRKNLLEDAGIIFFIYRNKKINSRLIRLFLHSYIIDSSFSSPNRWPKIACVMASTLEICIGSPKRSEWVSDSALVRISRNIHRVTQAEPGWVSKWLIKAHGFQITCRYLYKYMLEQWNCCQSQFTDWLLLKYWARRSHYTCTSTAEAEINQCTNYYEY